MGHSVKLTKNLTTKQLAFYKTLDEQDTQFFSLGQVEEQYAPQYGNMNEVVENLVHKGLLDRVERGKFVRTNFYDELAMIRLLVPDGALAYWSALNRHGLTEQFPNVIFVQTTKLKESKLYRGVPYQFIKVLPRKMTGIEQSGYGDHTFWITSVEKTILDCLDLPEYSGGFPVVVKAIARAKLHGSMLIEYSQAIGSQSAMKRLAFILESLGKKGVASFLKYAAKKLNASYSLLDALGPNDGRFDSNWKLRLNVTAEETRALSKTEY